MFGGAVANPAFVLSQVLAQMKDRGGHVKIPGFYDDVRALPRVGLLYGGVEGFLSVPLIGRYFLPKTVPHVKPTSESLDT